MERDEIGSSTALINYCKNSDVEGSSGNREKIKGWRFVVLLCAAGACLVFVINVIAAIVTVAKSGLGNGGRLTLYEGDCGTTGNINAAIHLVINLLSTVLLGSSNYCMQCLSAPTREEVNVAHARKQWLDIGVLSTRNLSGISRRRKCLWWMMGISSLPLHLFYNSAVFSSTSTNIYRPILVTKPFVESESVAGYNISRLGSFSKEAESEALRLRDLHTRGKTEQLDTLACLNAYSRPFQTRGSVLLVQDNSSSISILESIYTASATSNWVCAKGDNSDIPCDTDPRMDLWKRNITNWRPLGSNSIIGYCLSERVPGSCRVQSSLYIMLIVITLNAAKTILMLYIANRVKDMPLMTIGDAIVSYVQNPDPLTERMCLASYKSVDNEARRRTKRAMGAERYQKKTRLLFSAASRLRWTVCLVTYLCVLAVVAIFLYKGIWTIKTQWRGNMNTIKDLGLGTVSTLTIMDLKGISATGANSLLSHVVIANAAQPLLSIIYFSYNGLYTVMASALEWESYSHCRKGLRVSGKPTGDQRNTYFLQLPYRFGVPLLALSGLLHWTVSQAIFLVNIQNHHYDVNLDSWTPGDGDGNIERIGVGYSPLAIIIVATLGITMILVLVGTGSIHLRTGTPVVGSCSAAIAAACHVPEDENREQIVKEKVQWGVVDLPQGVLRSGHCAFSNRPVGQPRDGVYYE